MTTLSGKIAPRTYAPPLPWKKKNSSYVHTKSERLLSCLLQRPGGGGFAKPGWGAVSAPSSAPRPDGGTRLTAWRWPEEGRPPPVMPPRGAALPGTRRARAMPQGAPCVPRTKRARSRATSPPGRGEKRGRRGSRTGTPPSTAFPHAVPGHGRGNGDRGHSKFRASRVVTGTAFQMDRATTCELGHSGSAKRTAAGRVRPEASRGRFEEIYIHCGARFLVSVLIFYLIPDTAS